LAGIGSVEYLFLRPIIISIQRFQIVLFAQRGPEDWLSYIVTPIVAGVCVTLALMTCVSWGYALAITETTSLDRKRLFRWATFSTVALAIFCVTLKIVFMVSGDTGKNLVQKFGLDKGIPSTGTVFIIGGPSNHTVPVKPIQIQFTALIPQPKAPPIAFNATPENLALIEDWLNKHPISLYANCARWALAVGNLALWNVDTGYEWLNKCLLTIDSRNTAFAVLLVGPLKAERKSFLSDWADRSKWTLGPGYQIALAGQFLRYGDKENADKAQQIVRVSNDPEIKSLMQQYLPSDKAIVNGIIEGKWTNQLRPARIGLFRASAQPPEHRLDFTNTIKLLSTTNLSQFMNLIDSQSLKEDGSWKFDHLREGNYAVGFLFNSEALTSGQCAQTRSSSSPLNLSKQQSHFDLGPVEIVPCTK
jgi:hypothetical protein